eukprot:1254492-Amphidinium_carterae.1
MSLFQVKTLASAHMELCLEHTTLDFEQIRRGGCSKDRYLLIAFPTANAVPDTYQPWNNAASSASCNAPHRASCLPSCGWTRG